jgi:hypothetical protein
MQDDRTPSKGQDRDMNTSRANNVTAFHHPILAAVTGQGGGQSQREGAGLVNIIAYGDIEGFSPAYLCVDQTGKSFWRSQRDVTIVEPRYVPGGADQLRGLVSQLGGSSGSAASTR